MNHQVGKFYYIFAGKKVTKTYKKVKKAGRELFLAKLNLFYCYAHALFYLARNFSHLAEKKRW